MVGYIGEAYRVLIPETGLIMVFRYVRTVENTFKRAFAEQHFVLDESEPNQTGDNQVYPPPEIDAEYLASNPQNQLQSSAHYPNLLRSTRAAQEPDRYGKLTISAADRFLLDDPVHTTRQGIDRITIGGGKRWRTR